MDFDKKEHAKKLVDVETVVAHAAALTEGLGYASNGMPDKNFASMATGAFTILGIVLNDTHRTISEETNNFVFGNGLQYPIDNEGGVHNG